MRLCKKAPHDNLNLTERQHIHSLRLNFYLAAVAPHIYRLHAAPGSAAWNGSASSCSSALVVPGRVSQGTMGPGLSDATAGHGQTEQLPGRALLSCATAGEGLTVPCVIRGATADELSAG